MSVKIEKQIVGYAIKQDEATAQQAQVAESVPERDVMHEEIARPEALRGYTYKIKTPMSDHAMYITINNIVLNEGDKKHEHEHPFEIFINSKNMEQFQWILALTRVISAVFRKGGDAIFLIEELKQVFDPRGGYFKKGGRFVPSLVAEIGHVLETHMIATNIIQPEALSPEHQSLLDEKRAALEPANSESVKIGDYPPGSQLCNKCNTVAMVMMDGCMTCLACGESKCG